ncbi:MAG: hypothetical protein C5B59_13200 [Bacteroidetes bacterium]|nr:MAG: hypothetical protein C5B59_13200 [Bacteroidota bacterium]
MRTIIACFFCCLLVISEVFGQDPSFKKNAIYVSFEEFKTNSPSIDTLKLHMFEKTNYKRSVQYETNSPDSLADYKGDVWAFSDSNYLYIKHKGNFGLVMELGRYCVFSYMVPASNQWMGSSMMGSHGEMMGGPVRVHEDEKRTYYVLNFNSGEIEEMKVSNVKRYLADDEDLYNEYKNEDNQKGLMLEYIRKYNAKHSIAAQSK